MSPVFTVTYWGITGTLPTPLRPTEVTDKLVAAIRHLLADGSLHALPRDAAPEVVRARVLERLPFHLRCCWGGNTTCVEVQTPDALLILDCGTGFRELGIALNRRWNAPGYRGPRQAHVLLTHPHMDHTFATAFFDPYFDPRNHFTMHASGPVLRSLEAVLSPESSLSHLYFPPTFDLLKALRDWRTVTPGEGFSIGSTRVSTFELTHPGGCLGYRLENASRVFVFATDHEHPEVPDRALAEFARGSDLLYLDGQYLEDEYQGRVGIGDERPLSRKTWGHSSVEACVATAVAAGVRRLHIGHRDPKRDDNDLLRVETFLKDQLLTALRAAGKEAADCEACIPYEGMTVQL
ncbi:MAG: MBL fold metallo-hydrolase [Gemmataceae bacterium]|nr:MBL fold metallo-hydrolase [Gemmataceae bacterium]